MFNKYDIILMNYKRIYDLIIENRVNNIPQGYTETHHIVPRSLGGKDDKENLVKLSAREHYICHLLLIKIYENVDFIKYIKMCKAFIMMNVSSKNQNRNYKINSKLYEKLRIENSEYMSINQTGENNSQYNTKWVYNETERKSKKINADEELDENWQYGRKISFDYLDINIQKKFLKEQKIHNTKMLYNYFYVLYDMYGYDNFVKLTNYKYSKPNLVNNFKRYVDNYIPQNGKKRGSQNNACIV